MTSCAFDTSGLLNTPSPAELAQADAESSILVYMNGVCEDGRPYYAYIAIKPSRYGEFMARKAARLFIQPEEYGSIIASGFDAEPLPDVVTMMRDVFGYEEDYVEKLRAGVIEEYKIFLKKNEDNRINDLVNMLRKKQPRS